MELGTFPPSPDTLLRHLVRMFKIILLAEIQAK